MQPIIKIALIGAGIFGGDVPGRADAGLLRPGTAGRARTPVQNHETHQLPGRSDHWRRHDHARPDPAVGLSFTAAGTCRKTHGVRPQQCSFASAEGQRGIAAGLSGTRLRVVTGVERKAGSPVPGALPRSAARLGHARPSSWPCRTNSITKWSWQRCGTTSTCYASSRWC